MTGQQSPEETALRAAVENLYTTFARYPLPSQIDVSDSATVFDQERLRARPLRELRACDLEKYAFEALTSWGNELDFKHYLPRLLDLQAFDAAWFLEAEVLLAKLHHANWRKWPQAEQAAVEAYLTAWREYVLSIER